MGRIDFIRADHEGTLRSPMTTAALLLGIYVVMYLAVAGVLHALDLPAPSAATPAVAESTAIASADAPARAMVSAAVHAHAIAPGAGDAC